MLNIDYDPGSMGGYEGGIDPWFLVIVLFITLAYLANKHYGGKDE